jgi:predicted choloylglycine hydrolase
MRKAIIISSWLILFLPSIVFATAQAGDILIMDGKKYMIATNPLMQVDNSIVTQQFNANKAAFKKFRKSQFDAFKKTDEYRSAFAHSKTEDPEMKEEEIEEFLHQFYSERYLSLILNGIH